MSEASRDDPGRPPSPPGAASLGRDEIERGLMVAHNTGTNQNGELVFSFVGAKFAERRNKG